MNQELREMLYKGASEIGAPLSEPQVRDFEVYLAELKKWNKKINLTSLREDLDIIIKHFIDSLTPLPLLCLGSFVLDLGSGGGLPGIPMKIARPDIRLLLLDATGKKVSFLNHMIRLLKFKNTRALQQRAESQMFQDVMAGHLDAVVARAFGATDKTLEAGRPYLKTGGKLILMKGPRWEEEKGAEKRITGLKQIDVIHLQLPHLGDKRTLLVYEKL